MENRSKWVLFRIAIYRSSGYNPIFCLQFRRNSPVFWCFEIPCQDIRYRVAHACGSRCTRAGCKHWAPLWFTENIRLPMWILSIAISIIDLNVHRWSTTKLMLVNRSHESRSVASDGLTKCIQEMVSLNIYKNSANKFDRKIRRFKLNLTLKVKVNCHPK